ncbi:MAG: sugar phosphate isomerase/epimerase family protein [Verrucomicrobiota bacterium]
MDTKNRTLVERLAVCSWSLQPASPQDLMAKLRATGLRRLQLALDPLRESPGVWGETKAVCRRHGIAIVSGMVGCLGEDYTTLESIRRTGGVAPDGTWTENLKNIKLAAALAGDLGLKLVTFHAGFLPHEESDPNFARMLERLAAVAEVFGERKMVLGLETGQETAPVLLRVLAKLGRPNVAVNFDPANMILYDKGNPLEALSLLGPWVRQVHIKDARRTKKRGTWGQEVIVGTGEVDWQAFFATLREMNFPGDLVIEREAGDQRAADIRTARAVVEKAFGL